ncbi:MAG TPA: hypothetical protein VGS19_08275 [Streptosporangiaceae bacterium]|nr:hypothetical protein [Streptosporangiaceae bacterium]
MRVLARKSAASRGRAWTARILLGTALVGASAMVMAGVSAASVTHTHTTAKTSAHVVTPATRMVGGMSITMLVRPTTGRALYIHPGGPCTGSCLSIWPRLLMPKGTTTPTGAKCLKTVNVGNGRLQVTYMGQKLYMFTGDSGQSVNGNGVAGFMAAKVSPTCP